jgi:hypothetical protein
VRTNANTKRELAISAEIIDHAAGQIINEAEHGCISAHDALALRVYARGLRRVAESLFNRSQPARRERPR